MMIDITKGEMRTLLDALRRARDFFEHRDQMNAQLHCLEVRYSELTKVCDTAADLADGLLAAMEKR